MRHLRFAGLAALLGGFLVFAGIVPPTASAANAVVSGVCTRDGLADAIDTASDDSLITFDCDDPVITFAAGEQIIIGAGQTVTIDGSNGGDQIILRGGGDAYFTRFFLVQTGGTLTIQQLTMEGGNAPLESQWRRGGAIRSDGGTVNITASIFRYNQAVSAGGAIYNMGGTVTISKSVFLENASDYGGAIYQHLGTPVMTISDSRFEENSAVVNGGAVNIDQGRIVIQRSTFIANRAGQAGGAIEAFNGQSVDVTGSTFIDNSAGRYGSAVYVNSAIVTVGLHWSTIIQPDYGVPALYIGGKLTLEGVILAGEGQSCVYQSGNINDSYTFSNDASCTLTGIGSSNNVSSAALGLGRVTTTTVNGVDQTYHPLIRGSVAIDIVPSALCETDFQGDPNIDQLGFQRPVGSACEIGAVEYVPTTMLCANRWNGSLRMATNDSCSRSETRIVLPQDGPLTLCVNKANGSGRLGANCSRSERIVIVDGLNLVDVCVNPWNGALRVSDRCSRSESEMTL